MLQSGIKASELIKQLEKQIKLHGDCEVFAGGGDYPEGVSGVSFKLTGDSYHPDRCFRIH